MSTAQRRVARFKVGDWVSFIYGVDPVWAQIIEDRGPLGVKGRWIYRIRFGRGSGETIAFEVPEDDLVPAEMDRAQVIAYLKGGGLLTILRANLGGRREQPKAWLTFDRCGKIIPTLRESKGFLGGADVPFFALQEYRVFTPKAGQVVDFLASFGLTRAEAEDVVQTVGTAP